MNKSGNDSWQKKELTDENEGTLRIYESDKMKDWNDVYKRLELNWKNCREEQFQDI